jgi:hypothetical protein
MKICPRCHEPFHGTGATSRRDNKTEICSDCGTEEAVFDFINNERIRKEKAWLSNMAKTGAKI